MAGRHNYLSEFPLFQCWNWKQNCSQRKGLTRAMGRTEEKYLRDCADGATPAAGMPIFMVLPPSFPGARRWLS